MAFIILRYVPSTPTLVFVFSFYIMNGYWILSNAISSSIEMIMWFLYGFPNGASGKRNPPANAGDLRDVCSILGLGRSPKEEMATHCSILVWEIPWKSLLWAWSAIVHKVTKSWTLLKWISMHKQVCVCVCLCVCVCMYKTIFLVISLFLYSMLSRVSPFSEDFKINFNSQIYTQHQKDDTWKNY